MIYEYNNKKLQKNNLKTETEVKNITELREKCIHGTC